MNIFQLYKDNLFSVQMPLWVFLVTFELIDRIFFFLVFFSLTRVRLSTGCHSSMNVYASYSHSKHHPLQINDLQFIFKREVSY